jgi:hypothetical protein
LGIGIVAGTRNDINPELTLLEGVDTDRFRRQIERALGPVEPIDGTDGYFKIGVLDRVTGTEFKAYAGPSGPSYGVGQTALSLGPGQQVSVSAEVLKVLEAFDVWLEAATVVDEP